MKIWVLKSTFGEERIDEIGVRLFKTEAEAQQAVIAEYDQYIEDFSLPWMSDAEGATVEQWEAHVHAYLRNIVFKWQIVEMEFGV